MSNRKLDNKPLQELTYLATSALASAGLLVKVDTNGDYVVVAGVGGEAIGVSATKADAGEEIDVTISGIVPVILGGTVADGAHAESDASGYAITATGLRPIAGKFIRGGAVGELGSLWLGKLPTGPIVGANVASAAAIVPTGNAFTVTGTTNITSITSTGVKAGTIITITFAGILTFTDGSNLVLAGNMTTSADDTITLRYDGTNWVELCRSVN